VVASLELAAEVIQPPSPYRQTSDRSEPELSTRPHVPVGAQQQEQARRPPALAAKHTEQLSAAGAVGAADRTQSGPERRDRTTAVATVAAAQNSTSVARVRSTRGVGPDVR
jgi:hypothetical protein